MRYAAAIYSRWNEYRSYMVVSISEVYPLVVEAVSAEEAEGKALKKAREKWPHGDTHKASVIEIEEES